MAPHPRGARVALALFILLALVATGCGDGDATDAAGVDGGDAGGVEVTGEAGSKPSITLPDTEPPTDLIVVDLIEGDGEVVPEGAAVTTHYVGVSWTNGGEEFDSSWDRGQPATFPLSGVIAGWTEGIPGHARGWSAFVDHSTRSGLWGGGPTADDRSGRHPGLRHRHGRLPVAHSPYSLIRRSHA